MTTPPPSALTLPSITLDSIHPTISTTDRANSYSTLVQPPNGYYHIAAYGTGCLAVNPSLPRIGVVRPSDSNQIDFLPSEQTTENGGIFYLESTAAFEYIVAHVRCDGVMTYCKKSTTSDAILCNVTDKSTLGANERLVLINSRDAAPVYPIGYTFFAKWKSSTNPFCRSKMYNSSTTQCGGFDTRLECGDTAIGSRRGDERFQLIPVFGFAKDGITVANPITIPKRMYLDPKVDTDQIAVGSTATNVTGTLIANGLYYIFNLGNGTNVSTYNATGSKPMMISSLAVDNRKVVFNGPQTTSMNASIFRLTLDTSASATENIYFLSNISSSGKEYFCTLNFRIYCNELDKSKLGPRDRIQLTKHDSVAGFFYMQWMRPAGFCTQLPSGSTVSGLNVCDCAARTKGTNGSSDLFQFLPVYGIETSTGNLYLNFDQTTTPQKQALLDAAASAKEDADKAAADAITKAASDAQAASLAKAAADAKAASDANASNANTIALANAAQIAANQKAIAEENARLAAPPTKAYEVAHSLDGLPTKTIIIIVVVVVVLLFLSLSLGLAFSNSKKKSRSPEY